MVIERIGPLSSAKVAGVLYAGMGLVFGVVFSLVALVGGFATGAFAADPSRGPSFGSMLSLGAIILFPIGYAVIGFVMALIAASLYNVAAAIIGGIEIDVR
jgi:hypothetical protein